MHRGIPTAQSAAGKSRNHTGLALLLTSASLTSTNSAALTPTSLTHTDPDRLLIIVLTTTWTWTVLTSVALMSAALSWVTLTSAALASAALNRLGSSELATKFALTSLLFSICRWSPFRTIFKKHLMIRTYFYRRFSPYGVHDQGTERGFSKFFAL